MVSVWQRSMYSMQTGSPYYQIAQKKAVRFWKFGSKGLWNVCMLITAQEIFSIINYRVKVSALHCWALTFSLLQQLWNDLHWILCAAWRNWGLWRCRGRVWTRVRGDWGLWCRGWFQRREQYLRNHLSWSNKNNLFVNLQLSWWHAWTSSDKD